MAQLNRPTAPSHTIPAAMPAWPRKTNDDDGKDEDDLCVCTYMDIPVLLLLLSRIRDNSSTSRCSLKQAGQHFSAICVGDDDGFVTSLRRPHISIC